MVGIWLWRLFIAAVLIGTAILYMRGWLKLQQYSASRRSRYLRQSARRAAMLFLAGVSIVAIALLSPIYPLASDYFSVRVTQHLLLIGSGPALIMTSNPLPVLVQGLPPAWRRRLVAPAAVGGVTPHVSRLLANPGVIWLLFAAVFWMWYDPVLHDATIRYPWIRPLEVLSLFTVACLYWWHITAALPRPRSTLPPLLRVFFTFVAVFTIKLVGLIVMFSPDTIYHYPHSFRFSGLTVDDQQLGGIIFWFLGGLVYGTAAFLLVREWLGQEEEKSPLPESAWATEESMLAPGLKQNPYR